MDKKRIFSIVLMIIGIIGLGCGITTLIIKLNEKPKVADGEYLVEMSEWHLENEQGCPEGVSSEDSLETVSSDESAEASEAVETIGAGEALDTEEAGVESEQTITPSGCNNGSSVIWKFTEIGKGTLTTNNHLNDYDFQWTIKDGQLVIKTAWLYELENSYSYTIDQQSGVLILQDSQGEYRFVAQTE